MKKVNWRKTALIQLDIFPDIKEIPAVILKRKAISSESDHRQKRKLRMYSSAVTSYKTFLFTTG